MVKLLLGRDNVDPDKYDWSSHPPLSGVVFYGCEGVVKLLFRGADPNPDKPDIHDETPF